MYTTNRAPTISIAVHIYAICTAEITAIAAIADLALWLIISVLSDLDLCNGSLQLHNAVLTKTATNAIKISAAKIGVQ